MSLLLFEKAETYEELREQARLANPLAYITRERAVPPMLIPPRRRGPRRPLSSERAALSKDAGVWSKAEFYKILGAGHAVGIWIPDIDDVVLRFLRAHL